MLDTTKCPNPFCEEDSEIPWQGFEGPWMCDHCGEPIRVDNTNGNRGLPSPGPDNFFSYNPSRQLTAGE